MAGQSSSAFTNQQHMAARRVCAFAFTFDHERHAAWRGAGGRPMVRTYGLTHIALAVRDAEASFAFYQRILGVIAVYRSAGFIQAQTPETRDVLVFEEGASHIGERGGVSPFGFRLGHPADIPAPIAFVQRAGGPL